MEIRLLQQQLGGGAVGCCEELIPYGGDLGHCGAQSQVGSLPTGHHYT